MSDRTQPKPDADLIKGTERLALRITDLRLSLLEPRPSRDANPLRWLEWAKGRGEAAETLRAVATLLGDDEAAMAAAGIVSKARSIVVSLQDVLGDADPC